jgi:uncharacterized protein
LDLFAPGELQPKEDIRFAYVREQGYDRSCGYAAAASLLSLYWGLAVDEAGLIERIEGAGADQAGLSVSFEELARLFAGLGFSVKGVLMTWAQLEAALERYAPIIVHYSRPDSHFALAAYASGDWIVILDPASGCELLSRDQFASRWSGAALLVASAASTRNEGLLSEAIRVQRARLELLEGRQP